VVSGQWSVVSGQWSVVSEGCRKAVAFFASFLSLGERTKSLTTDMALLKTLRFSNPFAIPQNRGHFNTDHV
jgi:hypothetical protein